MNKENKKEILTRDIIKKDIKGILVHNILCNLLFSALFWFCVSMFYGIYLLGDSIEDIVKIEMFFILFFIALSVPCLLLVFYYIKLLLNLKKECFNITVDRVFDKKINRWLTPRNRNHTTKPLLSIGIFKTDLILFFEKHKKFYLHSGGHYSFSEINKMQYYQQFNSTEICDEFYLVTIDNKIIEIYNTKFFELRE